MLTKQEYAQIKDCLTMSAGMTVNDQRMIFLENTLIFLSKYRESDAWVSVAADKGSEDAKSS